MPSKIKAVPNDPGFIAMAINEKSNATVILYSGEEAGFDTTEGRWTIFCKDHGNFCFETNQKRARKLIKESDVWCEDCADIANGPEIPKRLVPFGSKSQAEQEKELRLMAEIVRNKPEKVELFERVYGTKPELYWD